MKNIFEKMERIDFDADYVIWGTGRKCEEIFELCKNDIKILYCVDRENKENRMIQGIPIYPISKIWEDQKKVKVIIASQSYLKMKEVLLKNGISEEDIFIYFEWEVIYAWYKRKQIILPSIAITTGNACNLKCRGCIAYIPYSKKKRNLKLNEVKETIDDFFNIVDYVESVYFGGGEILLNNEVEEIIGYFCRVYNEKFKKIYLTTNGTILPKEEFFHFCKMYNLNIVVSDYSQTISGGYRKLEEKLIEYHISYTIERDFIRDDIINSWYDMGNPEVIQERNEEELKELFLNCITNCRVLYDSKLWYCYSMVMGELGLGIKMESTDYCNMKEIDKNKEEDVRRFLENYLGCPLKGYYSMCRRCNGMGAYVNNKFIPAGEQIEE